MDRLNWLTPKLTTPSSASIVGGHTSSSPHFWF